MEFFILLEEGYLVTIVVNFVCKWAQQLFSGHYKLMSKWFIIYFQSILPIVGVVSIWSRGFTIFKNGIPKSFILNCYRSLLFVLISYEE